MKPAVTKGYIELKNIYWYKIFIAIDHNDR